MRPHEVGLQSSLATHGPEPSAESLHLGAVSSLRTGTPLLTHGRVTSWGTKVVVPGMTLHRGGGHCFVQAELTGSFCVGHRLSLHTDPDARSISIGLHSHRVVQVSKQTCSP